MIPVGRLAPGDQWDQNMLDLLFANRLYATGLEFSRHEGYPKTDGCILLIPGRYWFGRCNEISEAISRYQWVLAVRTGDEEDQLDPEKIYHPNIKWWVQTPHPTRDYGDARFFPLGFPPHFNDLQDQPRTTDVFLSAQNTHGRRNECFEALKRVSADNDITETSGFTQGLPVGDYAHRMCAAKVAPCPSGPESPESFRLFEALEAHTVPIADDLSPKSGSSGFWQRLFIDPPFPILTTYKQLPGYVVDQLMDWPANSNLITAWWMRYKRSWSQWLREDLTELGAL